MADGGSLAEHIQNAMANEEYDEIRQARLSRQRRAQVVEETAPATDAAPEEPQSRRLVGQYTAPQAMMDELTEGAEDFDPMEGRQKKRTIADRESEYQKRKYKSRGLSPERPETDDSAYREAMELRELEREERRVAEIISQQQQEENEDDKHIESDGDKTPPPESPSTPPPATGRKRRWDVPPEKAEEAPAPAKKRSRWDQPPPEADEVKPTALAPVTPPQEDHPESLLGDALLDSILPTDGYTIATPPAGYVPLRVAAHKLRSAPDGEGTNGFVILEDNSALGYGAAKSLPTSIPGVKELEFFKESDMKYFSKLLDEPDNAKLSLEELKERKVMRLLLEIKNGSQPARKSALRQITDQARYFGPRILFNQILPLLMQNSLEDNERHLLVKVIDRVLYKLGDLIRPFTHKILVVIEPLLIDDDYFVRAEGREVISNLSKAAGLAHMITTMRPDIDHEDEYVRNATARSFAIVASTLGIPALLPFLKAVCRSKKSWQARHTGIKIIQQIGIQMGCAILPHLNGMVSCVGGGLTDPELKVRTMTALALASLAEAAAPYGIESFETILEPLWGGVSRHRGKSLAAFIKCVGYVIPLMDPEYASFYTNEVMTILLREFSSPDEEMKKTVLKVVQQCASTEGVKPQYLRDEVMPIFFKSFWVRRMALDRRNSRLVIETTVELARKVGAADIVEYTVNILKDESEPYRRMAVEAIDKVISMLDAADISGRLEERLVDGILTAFQEQTTEDVVILNGFGTIVNALGNRTRPYIPQIASTILFRLGNQSPTVRQQAADLISRIAVVMKACDEDALMGKLGNVLYEQLGEEYPEVLGSILGALRSIVAVVGLSSMQPPIRDLLPRLTPILRNRHEKVQENAIDLVGRVADRGAEYVSAREWMRICFELLDMLKAHKKGIRRAANNTFGYIAKAIGPQDVLAMLLNNLKVQERQLRVCTAVAIGIVAETCGPFTVLAALMNEYRVPDVNVQNGVLKSMTFMFEYIGEMAKDYIYAVTPLVEDALTDRDAVHRQTAATVAKHLSLGVMGLGCEDAMVHLLNLLIPNVFETSPHVIDRMMEGIDGLRNAVGMGIAMNYVWAGLFHAARKVRTPYWRMYNSAYIQSADAMVPYYPELAEPEYRRDELDIWI